MARQDLRESTFQLRAALIFVLHVPEPSTFLTRAILHAMSELAEPEPFALSPWDITSENYRLFVERYQITEFQEPPAVSIIIPFTKVEPASSTSRLPPTAPRATGRARTRTRKPVAAERRNPDLFRLS